MKGIQMFIVLVFQILCQFEKFQNRNLGINKYSQRKMENVMKIFDEMYWPTLLTDTYWIYPVQMCSAGCGWLEAFKDILCTKMTGRDVPGYWRNVFSLTRRKYLTVFHPFLFTFNCSLESPTNLFCHSL